MAYLPQALGSKAFVKLPHLFIRRTHIKVGLLKAQTIQDIGINHKGRFDRHRSWLVIGNDPGAPAEALAACVVEPHRADSLTLPLDDELGLPCGYAIGTEPSLLDLKAVRCGTQKATLLLIGTQVQNQRRIFHRCITEDQCLAAHQGCLADLRIGDLAHR